MTVGGAMWLVFGLRTIHFQQNRPCRQTPRVPGWGPLNLVLEGHFILPIYIDLAATFLFGLTGALAALKRGYDWVGLFALAFATAVGGGLIRDGIFISQGPPAVTKDSRYILMVLASAGVGF